MPGFESTCDVMAVCMWVRRRNESGCELVRAAWAGPAMACR